MSHPHRRPSIFKRRYIVNKQFQYYFIVFLGVMCVAVISIDLLFYQTLLNRAVIVSQRAGVDSRIIQAILSEVRGYFQAFLASSVLVILLISGLCGLYLSHRIAGPIFRTLAIISQIVDDKRVDLPIRLRAKDCFPELENALNSLVTHVQKDTSPGSDSH